MVEYLNLFFADCFIVFMRLYLYRYRMTGDKFLKHVRFLLAGRFSIQAVMLFPGFTVHISSIHRFFMKQRHLFFQYPYAPEGGGCGMQKAQVSRAQYRKPGKRLQPQFLPGLILMPGACLSFRLLLSRVPLPSAMGSSLKTKHSSSSFGGIGWG